MPVLLCFALLLGISNCNLVVLQLRNALIPQMQKHTLVVEADDLFEGHQRVRLNIPVQEHDQSGIRMLKEAVGGQLKLDASLSDFTVEFFDKKREKFRPLRSLAQVISKTVYRYWYS